MSRRKLAAVAEATYRLRAGTATRRDTDLLDQVALQPLPGGYNNPLYRLRLDGRDLCLKLPVVDNRHRAQREWQTLTLLARRGRPLAPQPVWRAEHHDRPAILMTLLAGTSLGGTSLRPSQLDALGEALTDLYRITPADITEPLPDVVMPAPTMLTRLRRTWASPPTPASPSLDRDLQALWQRWSTGPDPHLLRTPTPQALGRGDPSLANILWDGTRLAMLDFEYAGWTDPAYELADLIEHPQSRATPDHIWDTFIDQFNLDPTARTRHHAARRMFSLFWLVRLSLHPDHQLTTQAERAKHLLTQ